MQGWPSRKLVLPRCDNLVINSVRAKNMFLCIAASISSARWKAVVLMPYILTSLLKKKTSVDVYLYMQVYLSFRNCPYILLIELCLPLNIGTAYTLCSLRRENISLVHSILDLTRRIINTDVSSCYFFLPFESVINTTSFRLPSSKQMAATIDHRQRQDGETLAYGDLRLGLKFLGLSLNPRCWTVHITPVQELQWFHMCSSVPNCLTLILI